MSNPELKQADEVRQRRVSQEAALRYVHSRDPRQNRRTAQEEEFVRAWLRLLPPNALIWDCPCGTGRFVNTAMEMGFRYAGGDFSNAMIGHAREASNAPQVLGFVACDAEHLPLKDNSVDCVLLWRLLHHIVEPDARIQMLREAARVSRDHVLVSFHHLLSVTSLRRWVQRKCFGGKQGGGEITHWRLQREAESCGLELVETKSFGKYQSVNWFACLHKRSSPH
jgi:hypothetical protein